MSSSDAGVYDVEDVSLVSLKVVLSIYIKFNLYASPGSHGPVQRPESSFYTVATNLFFRRGVLEYVENPRHLGKDGAIAERVANGC